MYCAWFSRKSEAILAPPDVYIAFHTMSKGFKRYHYLHQNRFFCTILTANDADNLVLMQIIVLFGIA